MATGFGVPHVDTAQGPSGTTPEDIQRIIAAEYRSAGIIDGCDITLTATMEYKISAGAVVLDTGVDMAVKVPVPATTVVTAAAPATGSRTDIIYVRQMLPTQGNPDNSAFVGVTSGALPANSIELDRRLVAAGTTATSATTRTGNRKFAVPIGGSLGWLHGHIETIGTPRTTGTFTRGAGKIYLRTDRDVEFRLLSTVSASAADGSAIQQVGSVLYQFFVDNKPFVTFERRFDGYWESKFFSYILPLSEGEHTVHYTVARTNAGDLGRWAVRHGGPQKFAGDIFHVYDRGVIRN